MFTPRALCIVPLPDAEQSSYPNGLLDSIETRNLLFPYLGLACTTSRPPRSYPAIDSVTASIRSTSPCVYGTIARVSGRGRGTLASTCSLAYPSRTAHDHSEDSAAWIL